MAISHFYNNFLISLGAKQINLGSDTFKMMLLTSSYVPNKGTHRYQSDLTNEVASGNGYTTGGATISPITAALTNTNAVQTLTVNGAPTGGTFTLTFNGQTTAAIAYNATAATVQSALTALSTIGAGNVSVTGSAGGPWTVTFQQSLAATGVAAFTHTDSFTGGSSPNLSIAQTTTGVGSFAITGANGSWPGANFTSHYAAVVDTTPGSAATNPLVGLVDFCNDISPGGATLQVNWDASGVGTVSVN